MVCEQCWADAFDRAQGDSSKSQTEHYLDMIRYAAAPPHLAHAQADPNPTILHKEGMSE